MYIIQHCTGCSNVGKWQLLFLSLLFTCVIIKMRNTVLDIIIKQNYLARTSTKPKPWGLYNPLSNIPKKSEIHCASSTLFSNLYHNTLASNHQIRLYSTPREPKKLELTNFEKIVLPSIIKTIKNWIFSTFIIRPYFDREFSLPEFVVGAKYALEIISSHLSVGDFAKLEGLVSEECIAEIKRNITNLSVAQRQELAVKKSDIYFSFPYEVGVMFDESSGDSEKQKRSVEITMVFHVIRGLTDFERIPPPALGMETVQEYRDKMYICNYRFIRDYTKDVSDQWTVNLVNHFKPNEQSLM